MRGPNESEADTELVTANVAVIIALGVKNPESGKVLPDKGIIVSNTHLFWNWKYEIVLITEFVRLKQMDKLLKAIKEVNSRHNFSAILCGDFNTSPEQMMYYYFVHKEIPADGMLKFLTPADHAQKDSNDLAKVVDDGVNVSN
jgi:mRNA deadenylase 3'-5' endonuclease subunit Ccr4